MKKERYVMVCKRDSKDAGNCNGCNKHSSYSYSVWDISLRNITVRVCAKCREELINKLQVS